jgi:hypothetical protein
MNITLLMMMMIIQFNSILYYLCAQSTAARPITDRAQCRYRQLAYFNLECNPVLQYDFYAYIK